MQYLIEDIEDSESCYMVIDYTNKCWSTQWYTNIETWDGSFSDINGSSYNNIKELLEAKSSFVLLLEHPNITPKLIQEYPELFI